MFWNEEEKDLAVAEKFGETVEGLSDRGLLKKLSITLIFGNIFMWLIVFLYSKPIYGILDEFDFARAGSKAKMILLSIPFGFGFWLAYCIFRWKFPTLEDTNINNEIMGSYNQQNQSLQRFKIYIGCAVFGIIQTLLVFGIVNYFGNK